MTPHAEVNGARFYYEVHGLDDPALFNRTVEEFLLRVEGAASAVR